MIKVAGGEAWHRQYFCKSHLRLNDANRLIVDPAIFDPPLIGLTAFQSTISVLNQSKTTTQPQEVPAFHILKKTLEIKDSLEYWLGVFGVDQVKRSRARRIGRTSIPYSTLLMGQ
jgi:hypothetical protein